VKKLILAIVLSIFVLGLWATSAMADSILFPWLVKSPTVLTLVSVVNTSDTYTSCENPGLHYEYWFKDASSKTVNTDSCTNSSFTEATSINDIVSFDAAGTISGGAALFNDQPPIHNHVTYSPDTFTMPAPSATARGFLIVDNNQGSCFENNEEASLYGEALVIQLDQGAAWGYVAFNGRGGGPNGPGMEPLSFNDGTDLQGEVMRSPRYFDSASATSDEVETTPVVLLPLGSGPGSIFKTKIFVTPVNYALWEYGKGPGTRNGKSNSRIQFCIDPRPATGVFPINSTCPTGIGVGYLSGDACQSNSAALCKHAAIYDNDEGELDGNAAVDVVCTTALDISDPTTGLLTASQIGYLSTTPGGQAWAYIRSMVGSFYGTNNLGVRDPNTESDSIIGKLEYQDSTSGFTIGGTTIHGAVNDFKWIRNSGSQPCYPENCSYNPDTDLYTCTSATCDWDLQEGINKVIQDDGFGDEE